MRVLSFYYTHKRGGLCKRLYRLQKALVERGHEVHYLSLDSRPGAELDGVIVHRMSFPLRRRSGMLFWFCFTIWLPLALLWRTYRLRPDCFVIFAAYYAVPARIVGWMFQVPRIVFLRSMNRRIHLLVKVGSVVRQLSSWWERRGVLGASRVVVMTDSMKKDLEDWISPRRLPPIDILPNDLTVRRAFSAFESSERDRSYRVLTAGVLDKRKNIGVLLEAWGLLGDLQEDASLVIAGEGSELPSLRAFSASHNLANVVFLGWSDQIEKELARCDLVVHPALHEGMPNIVMEALSCGVPVLLSDTSEHREIAGVDELLFPPNNPRALADQLHAFLSDPDRRAVVRGHCESIAKRYSFDWNGCAVSMVEQIATNKASASSFRD